MPPGSLCSFSASRETFCVFSSGGVINIWGCRTDHANKLISSTVLPNHLQAVSTCFSWCPDQRNSSAKQSSSSDMLAYGSSNGCLFVYNTSSSTVIGSLEKGHTGAVSALAWQPSGASLYSAADDGFIIEWNVKSSKATRRWRYPQNEGRGRGGYTALAVSSTTKDTVFAARQQIDVWNLQTGRISQTYVGHSSDVFCLLPITCPEEGDNATSTYVLSLAKNDRVMYAWRHDMSAVKSSQLADQLSPSAAFLLPDGAIAAKASFQADSHTAHIFVVLANGCIAAYRHVLNGKKIKEPIRHSAIIEILSSSSKPADNQFNASSFRLPVIDISSLTNGDVMTVAYGEATRPFFETFDMKTHWNEKHIKLHRDSKALSAKNVDEYGNSPSGTNNRFHVATVSTASHKSGQKRTLGDALKEVSLAKGVVQEANASSVLAQGLLSRDKRILDTVLGAPNHEQSEKRLVENQKNIEAAVATLDSNLLLTLLDELTARLASGHPAASQNAARWLTVLLRTRGARLASTSVSSNSSVNLVSNRLANLRDTLIARTLDSSRVLQLRGRLRMLREMSSASANDANKPHKLEQTAANATDSSFKLKTAPSATTVPRLPFVLTAADSSAEEDDDSDSAMESNDVDTKRRKKGGKARPKTDADSCQEDSEVSDASSVDDEEYRLVVDTAEDDDDDDDDDEKASDDDGGDVNGHDDDDDGGDMMDYDLDDDADEDLPNGHHNSKKKQQQKNSHPPANGKKILVNGKSTPQSNGFDRHDKVTKGKGKKQHGIA